ncbi:MAG: hypothetical protein WAT66_08915 [Actinomycetota bacterium]
MRTRAVVLAIVLGAIPLLLTGGSAGAIAGCAPLAGGFVCYEVGEGHGTEVLVATGDLAAAVDLVRDGFTGVVLYPRDLTIRALLGCDAGTLTYWVLAEVPAAGVHTLDTGVAC